jgi:hypothetical protein
MIRWTLKFYVQPSLELSRREQEKTREQIDALVKPVVDKTWFHGDHEIDLDSPKLRELVRVLEQLDKNMTWLDYPQFTQRLIDDEQTPVDWFILHPKQIGELGFGGSLPSGRADRMKAGLHVAGMFQMFVSERFKALVEAHRLTGVDFLWVQDTGKYRVPQWYLALPREPLGRGLDHPWFDNKKPRVQCSVCRGSGTCYCIRSGSVTPESCVRCNGSGKCHVCGGKGGQGWETADPRYRSCQFNLSNLSQNVVRSDAAFGDPVKDRLLSLAIAMSGRRMGIACIPYYLRAFLPDADFAFPLNDLQSDKMWASNGGLAINRRTKKLLVADRLISEEECIGVMVLDEPYPGAEVLDRLYGKPQPLLSEQEWARLRVEEARAWAEFVRNPKPVRAPSLSRALALLRARKRSAPDDFLRPVQPKAIQEAARALGLEIPVAWQKVLRISNGGRIKNCEIADGCACEIMPAEQLLEWYHVQGDYIRKTFDPDFSRSMVPVILTEVGDYVSLDTSKQIADGDCRVFLISHETGEAEREWGSVADFLEEVLTEFLEEVDGEEA